MVKIYRFLVVHHFLIAIGALFGGMAAMLDPFEPLGVPHELLDGSPFESYLIPGLILFTVIGLGNLFSAYAAVKRSKHQGYISSVFSWGLMIWIVIQCIMINAIDFLHVLYFVLGLLGAVLAMRILYEQRAFPTNLFGR